MLSIVVCSQHKALAEALKKNILETAGVPVEFIIIDNNENNYGIAAAYNKGAAEATGELICFVHEDIQFKTKNWGSVVQKALEDKKTGLFGVAGAYYYPLPPVGWFHSHELEVNVVQHYKFETRPVQEIHLSKFPGQQLVDVAVLDGLFLATRKEVMEKHKFDEALLKGYHGYDADISLQIGQSYAIKTTKEILIEHFSEGRQDAAWYNAMRKIAGKWSDRLPVFAGTYTRKEKKKIQLGSLVCFYRNKFGVQRPWPERFFLSVYYCFKQGLVFTAFKRLFK